MYATRADCGLQGGAGSTSRPGTTMGTLSRQGSAIDESANAAASAISSRSTVSRHGIVSRHASGSDVLADAYACGNSHRGATSRAALSRHASIEALPPGSATRGTTSKRGLPPRHPSNLEATGGVTSSGMPSKVAIGRSALSRHASAEVLAAGVSSGSIPSTSVPFQRAAYGFVVATATAGRSGGHDRQRPVAADVNTSIAEAVTRVERGDKPQEHVSGNVPVPDRDGAEAAVASRADHSMGTDAELEGNASQVVSDLMEARTNYPALMVPLIRLPTHKSTLKSAASLYAASGVVDDLFTSRETFVNGDAEPMTRARHHYGLSPRQLEEENEKRKEFASNLGAWYKAQLQRRARVNIQSVRTISRSNSKGSE